MGQDPLPEPPPDPPPGGVRLAADLDGVDWVAVTADLSADDFDNGRTPDQLHRSFEAAYAVSIGWDGALVVGTARMLADGVCNAYLVDVWTRSSHRRQGIGAAMVRSLLAAVPGHHVIITSSEHPLWYARFGFVPVLPPRDNALDMVVGQWLQGS